MLGSNTLREIRINVNTGVEYEIALFYKLLTKDEEKRLVLEAIQARNDASTVLSIYRKTDTSGILFELRQRQLSLQDVSFETQNDEVGPSDVVMYVEDELGKQQQIGLSVKYSNTCTLNVSGMYFITKQQRQVLERQLVEYTRLYIDEMTRTFGGVQKWFRMRKPSRTTDQYIDLIRDAVIQNWQNVPDKQRLFDFLFHADSPIEYWVYEYKTNNRYKLNCSPMKVGHRDVPCIEIRKYQTSYVAFYLFGERIAHMQVKFNNGFLESVYNSKGVRKIANSDFTHDGVEMVYGKPFGSWNFSIED